MSGSPTPPRQVLRHVRPSDLKALAQLVAQHGHGLLVQEAGWVAQGGRSLGKATKFEVRDGRF